MARWQSGKYFQRDPRCPNCRDTLPPGQTVTGEIQGAAEIEIVIVSTNRPLSMSYEEVESSPMYTGVCDFEILDADTTVSASYSECSEVHQMNWKPFLGSDGLNVLVCCPAASHFHHTHIRGVILKNLVNLLDNIILK